MADPSPSNPADSGDAPASGGSHLRPVVRRHLGIDLITALRPRQWTKNLLVFVAPAAAGILSQRLSFLHALGAFWIMCAAASGTYLLNDAMDAEADRRHPVKVHRPIASGAVSEPLAIALSVVLIVVSVAGAAILSGWMLVAVVASYITITVAYTIYLKREPVVELAAVASGFVLRAIAGGVVTHIPLSSWFLVVISFGALFIVTGKRAAESISLGDDGPAHRPVLGSYTKTFLQSTLVLTAGVTTTGYCLWAFERAGSLGLSGHHAIWTELTVAPVILGILHVLRLADSGHVGEPEEMVFHDRLLQILGLVWVVLFALGIYA